MLNWLKKIFSLYNRFFLGSWGEQLEWEISEMEFMFDLLTMGALLGHPAPPTPLFMELLPDMEKDLLRMLQREEVAQSALAQLASRFDVG